MIGRCALKRFANVCIGGRAAGFTTSRALGFSSVYGARLSSGVLGVALVSYRGPGVRVDYP